MTDTETSMRSRVVEMYDKLAYGQLINAYFGNSDFANYGYWTAQTADQKAACESLMDELLAWIPQKRGRILDVACGKGATTRHLLRHYRPRDVSAVNVSRKQLESARSNAPGCSFFLADATQLAFADGSFDNVVCVEAAFHFDSRRAFLAEARRVLKPGGRLVLTDILMTRDAERRRPLRNEKNFVGSPEEYKAVLEGEGFVDVEVRDETVACWHGCYRHMLAYFHDRYLSREVDQETLKALLDNVYSRVEDVTAYLLAAATRR